MSLTKEDKRRFNAHIVAARAAEARFDYAAAVADYERARAIHDENAALRAHVAQLRACLPAADARTDGWARDISGAYRIAGARQPETVGLFTLAAELFDVLFPHQRDGVRWLVRMAGTSPGAILADDMGLGKTIQVIAAVSGLLRGQAARCVLLVVPLSLLSTWATEFGRWAPEVRLRAYHGPCKASRDAALERTVRKGGVLLTTYGTAATCSRALATALDDGGATAGAWDLTVLDEGHRIKNPSGKINQCLRTIPARFRLILSGTPIQNNLMEMWSLFDYALQGRLFGTRSEFHRTYEAAILCASDREASREQRMAGMACAAQLRAAIEPYLLRREKKDVLAVSVDTELDSANRVMPATPRPARVRATDPDSATDAALTTAGIDRLPRKCDLVLWVLLAPAQLDLYRAFIESDRVRDLLNSTHSPLVRALAPRRSGAVRRTGWGRRRGWHPPNAHAHLHAAKAALTLLKKICDHPYLLDSTMAYCRALALGPDADSTGRITAGANQTAVSVLPTATSLPASSPEPEPDSEPELPLSAPSSCVTGATRAPEPGGPSGARFSTTELIAQSGKMALLVALLADLHRCGHRVLIFSQSARMLDLIQQVLESKVRGGRRRPCGTARSLMRRLHLHSPCTDLNAASDMLMAPD